MKIGDNCDNAIDEMGSDVEMAVKILNDQDTPFNRRNYVRALFAYFEAFAFFMRRNSEEIINRQAQAGKPVDIQTLLLLSEKIPIIGEDGKPKLQVHRPSFKNQFAFTFRVFLELIGIRENPFLEDGWKDLKDALDIRHRLTHPKIGSDVIVTDADLAVCRRAYMWFVRLVLKKPQSVQ